jgi:ornithine cyclodeaminase/alanine dehydrogenase-like protein (mu-crystallin family)
VLILSRSAIEPLLSPPDIVDALGAAFRRHAEGRTAVPPRTVMPVGDRGLLLVMPAAAPGAPAEAGGLGAKLVTFYPDNRARGHPTHLASYLLLDHATGAPLALLEATLLTGLRTGGTSALAARHLARPDSRTLVCFGASVQARHQVRALAGVLPIERVIVVGRDPDRARAFAEWIGAELGLAAELARDAATAVRRADVVTCATTSPTPVLSGADLRPGTHVDAIGAFRPTTRELDTEAICRARVTVETYAGVLEEAGDLVIPLREGAIRREDLAGELAEVVAGSRQGRRSADDITVFKSVGFALEDLAIASLAYNRAMAAGAGTQVTL